MKITVIELLNPFNKNERNQYTVKHVQSIRDILDKKNIVEFNLPTICFVNNAPVLRKDWDVNNLKHGDTVVFASQMQGFQAGWALYAFITDLTVTQIVYGVLTIASIAAGIALQPPEMANGREPDPTYSLNGANNQLRLNNPIEVAYGRNKLWPSYASRPFTRYLGNEQYLYQLLCLGQGEFDIEGVFIDDTNINDFLEVEWQPVPPNQQVTLIPTNVATSIEVSNIELEGKTTFLIASITRGYPTVVTTSLTHDVLVGDDVLFEGLTGMPNQYYPVTAVTTTTITLDYDSTGLPAYTLGNVFSANWTTPFNANPSGTLATQLEVDLIHTTGIYYQDSKGGTWSLTASALFQYQEIDDTGTPIGAWTTLKDYNEAAYSLQPLRKTFTATVPAGRYRVRARRTNADSSSTRDQDTIAWGALRAVLEDTTDYGNVTLIAIKAKATNNLNSNSSNKVSCIATRKLPIYNGTVWSAATATRNPVWAFCDAVRANYGAKLADTYLDLTSLLSIATALDTEAIRFDWVFDQKSTLWEVLTVIAKVAYGSPTIQGSVFSIVRDVARTLPSGVFNQENILKGSLQWDVRLFEQGEYDSVEIEYIDETTWKAETVVCSVESSPEDNPEKIKLIGCMNRDKAYQYGLYLAAAKRYRRETINFSTGKEGLIPTFGDLISISHDVPRWGSGGYVVDIDVTGLIIETSEPVTFGTGNHYIILRKKDGTATDPLLVTVGVDSYHVVLDAPLVDSYYFDDVNEPPFYHFGKADLWAKLAIVTSTKPNGKQVEIQAIPYDTRLYQFYSEVAPAIGSTTEVIVPALPTVTGLAVKELPNTLNQVLVSWNVAEGATSYVLQSKSGDALNWETVTTVTTNSFVLTVEPIYLFLRVAGINKGQGAWDTWEGDVGVTQFLPYDVNSVELVSDFVGDSVSVQWNNVVNVTGYKVEVRQDAGATLIRTTNVLTPNFAYTIGDAIVDADINRALQIRVYATNSNGDSAGYEFINVSNPIPAVPTGFAFVYSSETSSHVYYTFEWTANIESDIESYRVYGSTTSGFTPGDSNKLATVQDATATIQLAKSPKTKSIGAISKATDAVITTTSAHGIDVGDFVEVTGVVGMTELNGNTYGVLAKTTNTLTIDVDSTGFTAYTSGGTVTTTNNYASTYYFKLSAKDLWGDDINATSQIMVTP